MLVNANETTIQKYRWNKQDIGWLLSIYGSAIGAGILFLPVEAGIGGLFPFAVVTLLAFPITYFSNKAFAYLILADKDENVSIIHSLTNTFGKKIGAFLLFLYFFDMLPLLVIYSSSLINNFLNMFQHMLAIPLPPRWLVALTLVSTLTFCVHRGRDFIVKLISLLVAPLLCLLIVFSVALIPYWNGALLTDFSLSSINLSSSDSNIVKTLWLTIPIVVFTFNYSFLMSSFVNSNKKSYGEGARTKIKQILFYSSLLMITTSFFFAFSCLMVLGPQDLIIAREYNLNILDYLSKFFSSSLIGYAATSIASIAIFTSFAGLFLGAQEGLSNLLLQEYEARSKKLSRKTAETFATVAIFFFVFFMSLANLNSLTIIETVEGPIVGILFFIMPVYAIYKLPSLKKYRCPISDIFIIIIGILAISTFFGMFII